VVVLTPLWVHQRCKPNFLVPLMSHRHHNAFLCKLLFSACSALSLHGGLFAAAGASDWPEVSPGGCSSEFDGAGLLQLSQVVLDSMNAQSLASNGGLAEVGRNGDGSPPSGGAPIKTSPAASVLGDVEEGVGGEVGVAPVVANDTQSVNAAFGEGSPADVDSATTVGRAVGTTVAAPPEHDSSVGAELGKMKEGIARGMSTNGVLFPATCESTVAMTILPLCCTGVLFVLLLAGESFTNLLHSLIIGSDLPPGGSGDGEDKGQPVEALSPHLKKDVFNLTVGAWIACLLIVVQVTGGLLANSAALFALTGKMISQASESVMSICALKLMSKRATPECSFGLHQVGALGTFLTMLFIWIMAMVLVIQVVHRFFVFELVSGPIMVAFGAVNLLATVLLTSTLGNCRADLAALLTERRGPPPRTRSWEEGLVLSPRSEEALRSRPGADTALPPVPKSTVPALLSDFTAASAYVSPQRPRTSSHQATPRRSNRFQEMVATAGLAGQGLGGRLLADVLLGLLVVLAGALMWWEPMPVGHAAGGASRWGYADLLVASICVLHTFFTTRHAFRESLMQLLMACPRNLNLHAFQTSLCEVPGVLAMHDLHVWQIGPRRLCSAHLSVANVACAQQVLRDCSSIAQKENQIDDVAFQIQVAGADLQEDRLRLSSTTCHDTVRSC